MTASSTHGRPARVTKTRIRLLSGLIDMADCPLTELPGFRFPERSPMWRFTRIGSAVFVFFVAEPQGVLIPIDIRE